MSQTTGRQARLRFTAAAAVVALALMTGCSSSDDSAASSDTLTSTSSSASLSTSSSTSDATTEAATSATSATESSAQPPAEASTAAGSTAQPTTEPPAPTTTASAAPTTTTDDPGADPGTDPNGDPDDDPDAPFTGNPQSLPLTPPGTQLSYGQSATVPVSWAGEDGVLTISDLSVTQGTEADWEALGADPADSDGERPWYLKVTLKQESGGDFAFLSADSLFWPYNTSDESIGSPSFYEDDNPLCPYTDAGDSFKVGDTYTACIVLSVYDDETIDRVQFEGDIDSGLVDNSAGAAYVDSPIVWRG